VFVGTNISYIIDWFTCNTWCC